MNLRYYLPIVLFLTVSCQNSANKEAKNPTKLLDYGYFTIRVPKTWKQVNIKGFDSQVGEIYMDTKTSIGFDLGWYSNPLDDGSEDYIVRNDSLLVKRTVPLPGIRKNYRLEYYGKSDSSTLAALHVNNKEWIKIEGYLAKLITPTHTGKGITGIYIDSLWKAGADIDRFQLSGRNLSQIQQQQLLAAIKTLRFYRHSEKRKENSGE